jgi:hypothetical protein
MMGVVPELKHVLCGVWSELNSVFLHLIVRLVT